MKSPYSSSNTPAWIRNIQQFFQSREASNIWYKNMPDIVQEYMDKISALTGRSYHLFDYYGAPDAEFITIAMGSVTGTIQETVDALNEQGIKAGYIQVHLYRPFSLRHFLSVLPETAKAITVMDRTKEAGALGEPLFEDVCTALRDADKDIPTYACRYGIPEYDQRCT